jgi:Domain of unknown function (DUF5916)/Carbohydrate family 9 binding domain-like
MNSRTIVFFSLLALASPLADAAATTGLPGLPPIEPSRAEASPVVDGILDDAAWSTPPLQLGEWLTYNPLNGSSVAQRTEVRVTYDSKALYFAFHCIDPEPDKIRGTLSRRDQQFNDDWVGLSLDSMGNGQASYDLFVNPRGVQGDVLTTSSAGENSAPDWVWQSAATRTAQGYDVELRLPLTSIRFKSGASVSMGVLFWRRVSRLGVSSSWPSVPAGKSFIESHARIVFHDLKRPLTLELIPSLTYSWNQARLDPSGFGPADSTPDAGLSAKYGLTSAVTVEGTFNPDFSQVESDAFQVEVNQRYPLFFSEKRPFFMEGMGTFELAGSGGDAVMRTAVHTRRIADPRWGGKLTGTLGRFTFASLSAGDEAPGRPVGDTLSPFPGDQKLFNIGRAVYSLGPNSYAGALVTDTEFGRGFNRVGGLDVSLKRGKHSWSATGLATTSRSAEGDQDTHGVGGQTSYAYESKRFLFANQLEHYARDFQMDTAFLNQTGITADWVFTALSFYPDEKKHPWLKRIVPFVFSRGLRDEVQGGDGWFLLPGIRMHFTRQGFFRVDTGWGQEPWAQRTFSTRSTRVIAQAQITRWLNLGSNYQFGRSVYYDAHDPFVGRSRSFYLEASFQPSSRFNQYTSWNRVSFDRLSGESVYDVDVLYSKTSFQFDRRFQARTILQYDSSRKQLLTDVLGSFEPIPGTVAFLGYGSSIEQREWDGRVFQPGHGDYATARRGFFFKASYIHRF